MWCGTWYGLSRFNGETFKNYTEAEGLWDASVSDIIEDDEGHIWVSDGSRRLATFDGKDFKLYNLPTDSFDGLHFNSRTQTVRLWNESAKEFWEVKGDTVLPVRLPNFPNEGISGIKYHAPTNAYFR